MAEPELAPTDIAPRMRADLRVHKRPGHGQLVYEVEDPAAGKSYPLHDFELSIARMLNGQRTVLEVLEAAGDIGIPVSLPSFHGFLRKLGSLGLLDESGSTSGELDLGPGTTWELRDHWPEPVRAQFQNALKAYRTERLGDAKHHLQLLLAVQRDTPEAQDMLRCIDRLLSTDPRADKARSFSVTYNAAERTWFSAGDTGRSVTEDQELPEPLPESRRRWLYGAGAAIAVIVVGLSIPLPFSVSAPFRLHPRSTVELKMPRAGMVAETLVADGHWVDRGALVARLDGSELNEKLAEKLAAAGELKTQLKKNAVNAKKAAAAKAKLAKAELEVRKAQGQYDQLLAKAKHKRTSAVVKLEKKLAALKATAASTAKQAVAGHEAGSGRELESELASLLRERTALEAEIAALALTAPAAGFLAGAVKTKQFLAQGAVVARIEDTGQLRAVAVFPDRFRPLVREDQPMALKLDGPRARTLETKVAAVSGTGSTFEVAGVIENADHAIAAGGEGSAKVKVAARSMFGRLF